VNDSAFRANAVSPGGILDHQPAAFLQKYKQQSCGKGMLDPNDLCGTIAFLLSDDSKYLQGQNLIVDDGFTL
jgi:NAD(P)-dependent dehydrogenase (short-subunit alcohol dehydrogenase family)